ISLQKFQQKALKQTKQKKSKSAEFLMVKEDREVMEGIGNPAFNMSSPDLLAHQTSDKSVIRHDMPDHTLAAHQQKFRAAGNEYSRNYFDPLMDEEINPRQCGMEVSREGELELSMQFLCLRKPTFACNVPSVFLINCISFLFSLIQDLKFEGEGLNQYIPMSNLKTDKTFEKYVPSWQVEQGQAPECLQIQIKCVRGLKNKTPQGSYLLRVSLLRRPSGCVLQWRQTEQLKTRTHPMRHDGNFYDVGLYFHESLYVVLPPKKDVKPGMAFLFELCLLRGKHVSFECVMGWAAFPLCDNNFDVVEGKFKCPLLRGHYDQTLDNFKKMEDLICLDLDHWLCNLYFQVIKLPLYLDDQKTYERQTPLPPEFPVSLMAEAQKAEPGVENTPGLSERQTEETICASLDDKAKSSLRSISNKVGPCPMDCDLDLLKEDHELHKKFTHKGRSLIDHSVMENSAVWRTKEIEDYSEDASYLEELEKHRFSVCSSSVAGGTGSGGFFKHLHFVRVSVFSELQLAQWRSQGFWYIILLMASLWFLRLYLHYLGQWLLLQAISTPVTKFHFSPFTVELCYPTSSLQIAEELLVVVVGPLGLNAVILPLVLIRWGCQLLFASCPDVLSKLIITMGLWTILDPLAVFIVDTVLGRLMHNGDTPIADAAKLYWVFVRTMESGVLGIMLTVLIYVLLFIISSLILYLYCLRLHSDSWILDAFQRIHSEEAMFFMPYDLEISNQELSYIVKRSEQWRGIHGERKKVAVCDYIWENHGVKSRISSCDLQQQNKISVSALGPGDVTSHVSICTVYPSGFQELYRHFLRLPSGAIVEVFGDISGLRFIPTEMVMAIQEQMSELDSIPEDSFDIKSREMKRIH
uniref:Orofacial cleft 1 candidate gene 1 protein n=1 Tax=Canis lupus dingo TaxID=286419 RepID=A0A8C0R0F0_CANLU